MDIEILHDGASHSRPWTVRTQGGTFSFPDQASAITFADKLKERVEADHRIPEEVIQRWGEQLSRGFVSDKS